LLAARLRVRDRQDTKSGSDLPALNFAGEIYILVGAIAEGLIAGLPAPAERNGCAGPRELLAQWIYDLDVARDYVRTVVVDLDGYVGHIDPLELFSS
jgi:hypothetical protein